MSNKIKKQSLLGKTPSRKPATKTRSQNTTGPTKHTSNNHASKKVQPPKTVKKNAKKFYALAFILLALLIIPKPKLLTYEKLGMVSQSVYWPGLFGVGASIYDSTLQPRADLEKKVIYLCQDIKVPASCQKYRITEEAGVFAALKKLILD